MFGYISTNTPELKVKDHQTYRSFYCGLCKSLKKCHGRKGQLTLSFDMTFFVVLHTALYEPESIIKNERCVLHPFTKHQIIRNQYSDYAGDINIILTYLKLMDNWIDEKKKSSRAGAAALSARYKKAVAAHPEKAEALVQALDKIHQCEKEDSPDLDRASGYFGEAFAEFFVYRRDEWEPILRRMGFFLGKFIYLMDAYEDLEDDLQTGNYNPFRHLRNSPEYEEECLHILTMMMAECAKEFEKLPIVEHIDILRNILYSGVWTRYEMLQQKRKEHDNDQRSL